MNIPLGEWSGSKTTKDLEYTIERIQKENASQSRLMCSPSALTGQFELIA